MNDTCFWPAGTGTEDWIGIAAVLLLLSVITAAPVGASAVSWISPVTFTPPITCVGLAVKLATAVGTTLIVAETLLPFSVVVSLTDCVVETVLVGKANEALVSPAGTVPEPLGITAVLLLTQLMGSPPVGAGLLIVTVPAVLMPPVIGSGVTVKLETAIGVTVTAVVAL
jgi:hypothetical protein